jgi:hypothetical protein
MVVDCVYCLCSRPHDFELNLNFVFGFKISFLIYIYIIYIIYIYIYILLFIKSLLGIFTCEGAWLRKQFKRGT